MMCAIESGENTEKLLAYRAGRLDPATRETVERHLAICPACRAIDAGQSEVWQALDGWQAVPVSADFDRRLYSRIEREAALPWWQRIAGPLGAALVRRGLPIVAAACLLVAAGVIADFQRTPAGASGDVRAEAVAADQVERTLDDMELFESVNREVRAQTQAPNSI